MTGPSKIQWTEHSWNPVIGCSIVSPGCTNCYAMQMASRIEAMGNQPRYAGTTKKVNTNAVWTGKLAQAPESVLLAPLKRKKPTTYFVNSMGDLFHDEVPDEWIDEVFAVMALSPQHTFRVLTKRAKRMRDYMDSALGRIIKRSRSSGASTVSVSTRKSYYSKSKLSGTFDWPLPNVWLGVSTERQQEADERIPPLLQTPAAVRFISAEPLLGPIDLTHVSFGEGDPRHKRQALSGQAYLYAEGIDGNPDMTVLTKLEKPMARLDWVICGGESGPGARPMHPDWARSLRDQCTAAGVPFFFKQWGQFVPFQGDMERFAAQGGVNYYHPTMKSVGKKAAGRLLDGIEHNGMPERAA